MSTLVDNLKRQAKEIVRATGCKHCHALEQLARNNNFGTWAALLAAEKAKSGNTLTT